MSESSPITAEAVDSAPAADQPWWRRLLDTVVDTHTTRVPF